jgi:sugar/nucleoside kinase (ribokinase family)
MIYAFGDVNLDCVWDFQETPSKRDVLFPELGTSNYRLGGVAYNLFAAAAAVVQPACVVGKVGWDEAGHIAVQRLPRESGHLVFVDAAHPTGSMLILRFQGGAGNARHFVYNAPNANQYLTRQDIVDSGIRLTADDILFLTGYSLFRKPVAEAAQYMVSLAEEEGARIVIDVVPHNLQAVGSPEYVREQIFRRHRKRFDLCIAEWHTWQYIFGLDSLDASNSSFQTFARIAEPLTDFVSVRYGFENCGREAVLHGGELLWDSATGYEEAEPEHRLAFGDQITMALLQQLLLGRHTWTWQPDLAFTVPLSVLEFIPPAPGRKFALDVGCGYGRAFPELLRLGFRRITGIENSSSLVARARAVYPPGDSAITIIQGDACNYD